MASPQLDPETVPPPVRPAVGTKGLAIAISGIVVVLVLGLVVSNLGGNRGGVTSAANAGQVQTTQPAAPVAADPTAMASTAPTPSAASYRCWDDSIRASRGQCTKPTGFAGVRWVFPGFTENGGTCQKVSYRKTTNTYECTFAGTGLIRYRYWKSKSEAMAHYSKKYKGQPTQSIVVDGVTVGQMWRYREPMEADNLYKLSGFFMDNFSFSIDTDSSAQIDRLSPYLKIRNPVDLRASAVSEAEPRAFGINW
jgi:hypothetical protein